MSEIPSKTSESLQIPTRRVVLNDPSNIPLDYSTTPGGTWFSTTPGGTRIIYDRAFLLKCRNSPLSKSVPKDLPDIPGVTTISPESQDSEDLKENEPAERKAAAAATKDDDHQFDMDM